MNMLIIMAVLTVIGILAAWFYLPERIKMMERLPSEAEHLFRDFRMLVGWKDDMRQRVDRLLSDESKATSKVATEWFVSVDRLDSSIGSIKERYDTMKSIRDRLLGILQYYRLTTEVYDCSVEVKDLLEMRNNFKDEDLIADVTEFVLLIKAVKEKVSSYENVTKKLESTMRDLENKIKPLENDGMERDGQVSHWFRETQQCLLSFEKASPCYPHFIQRQCQRSSSSSFCTSIADACEGCRRKYDLSKVVGEQIVVNKALRDEGTGYLSNVENCVGPVPELLVVIRKLAGNCSSLESQKKNLESRKHEIEKRVSSSFQSLQQSGIEMERSDKVTRWFSDVESVITRSSQASQKWNEMRNEEASPCSRKCSSILHACQACSNKYTLGKEVEVLLQELQLLEEKANGDHFKYANEPVFYRQKEMKKALKLIAEDHSIGMVGICGKAGIGKTTLLRRINNHFHATAGIDVVIFVTVGGSNSILEMQQDIGEKLDISFSENSDEGERAAQILGSLRSKSFLIFLDDLGEKIELGRLGIPPLNSSSMEGRELQPQQPKKKQKVVITARDRAMCDDMGSTSTSVVELELLSREMSWHLFCNHLNNIKLLEGNSEFRDLARYVADKCNGLPLALVTVGKTMSRYVEASLWRNAKIVFSQLKLDFEVLESGFQRRIIFLCMLLHCHLWHPSTFIATLAVATDVCSVSDWKSAHEMAVKKISELVHSGWLMFNPELNKSVRLHQCVHDMLLSLTETEVDKYGKIMLRWSPPHSTEQRQSYFSDFLARWEGVEMISMDGCHVTDIPMDVQMPNCSSLQCLDWPLVKLFYFPEHFFHGMTSLRVLYLEKSNIRELPRSFGYQVVNLKYLDLSYSRIEKLSEDIGNLRQLVSLHLCHTEHLHDIPCSCLSGLQSLQLFCILGSAFRWTWDNNNGGGGQATLQSLEELKSLQIIKIYLKVDAAMMHGLLRSEGLLHSIEKLTMDFCVFEGCIDLQELFQIIAKMENAKSIELENFPRRK